MMLVGKNVSVVAKKLDATASFLHGVKKFTYNALYGTANFGILSLKMGVIWGAQSEWGRPSTVSYAVLSSGIFFAEWYLDKNVNYWKPLVMTAAGVVVNGLMMNYFNDGQFEISLTSWPTYIFSASSCLWAIASAEPKPERIIPE